MECMAERIPAKLIALACILIAAPAFANPLLEYNFDAQLLEPGPDTFQVFKNNRNNAALIYEMAHSGSASIHLTDPIGDGDFVEFQGYFERHDSGLLSLEFSFLLTDTATSFSMALTGEKRYKLDKNGINFWLRYDSEWLRSYSNSIPKKLFQPEAFVWYTVRADLDFEKNAYALRIADEREAVHFAAQSLPMAPGSHAQHSVMEFSFVGDIYDKQPSDFFIDSFRIRSSTHEAPPLLAPGRRTLFVDQWNAYQMRATEKLQCLPAIDLKDIGIEDDELAAIFKRGEMEELLQLTARSSTHQSVNTQNLHPSLQALSHWKRSCELLAEGNKATAAHQAIEAALAIAPQAYIYRLNAIIIDAASLTPTELLGKVSYLDSSDLRSEIALAMIASHHKIDSAAQNFFAPDLSPNFSPALGHKLAELEANLKETSTANPTALALEQLKNYMPEEWEAYLAWSVAAEYEYLGMLGAGNYDQASEFANQIVATLSQTNLPSFLWQERNADTALLLNQPQVAAKLYENLRSKIPLKRVELKLSDAYYLLGNYESERALRESIYRNFDSQ